MEGKTQNEGRELRVAITIPEEGLLISPQICETGKFKLFTGTIPERTSAEQASYALLSDRKYGLPPMTAYYDMRQVDGVHGFAVRPISERKIDFRQFIVGKHPVESVLDHLDELDELDREFIDRLATGALLKGRKG